MPRNYRYSSVWRLVMASATATALLASEHRGVILSAGLPVPGATVTAINGDKKVVTTTDENGDYSFPNLEDGVWTVQVSMLGFAKATKEIGIAPAAPTAQWELKFQSLADLKASIATAAAPPAASAAPASALKVSPAKAPETTPAAPPPPEA